MKKYLYFLLLFYILLFSCKKEEEPTKEIKTPIFYFDGIVDNEILSIDAGINNFYLNTFFYYDTNQVCSYVSDFIQINCDTCEETISFKIRDYKKNIEGSNSDINEILYTGNYIFRNYKKAEKKYRISFLSDIEEKNYEILEYSWDFGDGKTSNLKNPVHLYDEKGKYQVCLNINFSDAYEKSICNEIIVSDNEISFDEIDFNYNINLLNVAFEPEVNNSDFNYLWDFDDGNISTEISPEHNFSENGTYEVCLTIDNGEEERKFCKNVEIEHIIYKVNFFHNLGESTNLDGINFIWDFGDGTTENQILNPTHIYNKKRTYEVSFFVWKDGENDTSKLYNELIIDHRCATDFSYELLELDEPKTVFSFSSDYVSEATNSYYSWDFGNETGTSTDPNPVKNLPTYEINKVCLYNFDNSFCQISKCKNILVANELENDFFEIKFYPNVNLNGEINFSNWDFGDAQEKLQYGETKKISHFYLDENNYYLNLDITFNLDTQVLVYPYNKIINVSIPDTCQTFFIQKRDTNLSLNKIYLEIIPDPLENEEVYFEINWGDLTTTDVYQNDDDNLSFEHSYNFNGLYNVCVKIFRVNDGSLKSEFCKNIYILEYTVPSVEVFYQMFNFSQKKIVSNFSYEHDYKSENFPIINFNYKKNFYDSLPINLDFSTVAIEYKTKNGETYSSYFAEQDENSYFEIVSVEDYKNNMNGYKTKKITVNLGCHLYNENKNIKIENGKAIIAISYE